MIPTSTTDAHRSAAPRHASSCVGSTAAPAAVFRLAGLSVASVAVTVMTFAASVAFAQGATVKKAAPKKWPIGGMVTLGSSAGIGTFVPGEANRPAVSSSVSLLARVSPAPGLTLMASQGISKTLVDNSDDPFAPRKRNTTIGDTILIISWTPLLKDDGSKPKKELSAKKKAALAAAAAVNPTLVSNSSGKPLTLPGDIRLSFLSVISLPTSKIAQYQTRLGVVALAANFRRVFGSFSLTYQIRYTKNFHRYSNAVVDTSAGLSAIARGGGVEAVGDSQVATSFNNISFNIRNALIASLPGPGKLSFQALWIVINNYRYFDAPQDEYTSIHAKSGRGRLDLSFGQLAANYVFGGGYIGSFNISTFSTPKTADNSSFRFPFFDFRSTPDNLTSFGLSVTKMF